MCHPNHRCELQYDIEEDSLTACTQCDAQVHALHCKIWWRPLQTFCQGICAAPSCVTIYPLAAAGGEHACLSSGHRHLQVTQHPSISSARVAASSTKLPRHAIVVVPDACFSTPRATMHRCTASMTTRTPAAPVEAAISSAS